MARKANGKSSVESTVGRPLCAAARDLTRYTQAPQQAPSQVMARKMLPSVI
jgi:hypothetical protein